MNDVTVTCLKSLAMVLSAKGKLLKQLKDKARKRQRALINTSTEKVHTLTSLWVSFWWEGKVGEGADVPDGTRESESYLVIV